MREKALPSQELFEKLETLRPGMFTDLLKMEGGPTYAKLALLYIIHAYSKESQVIVLGERDGAAKMRIAEYVNLPDRLHGPVVLLQSEIVREVVLSYLNAQNDRRWQHLCQNKELYEVMRDNSIKSMRKEDGSIDFKGMVDAAKYRDQLHASIEEAEQQYREEYGPVMENIGEIKKMNQKSKKAQSLSVESSDYVI